MTCDEFYVCIMCEWYNFILVDTDTNKYII